MVVGSAVRDETNRIEDILIVGVNERAARMAGHPAKHMVGQRNTVLFPGIRQTPVFDLYVRTIETGFPQELEIHYDADGLNVWANLSTAKFDDGLVITWTDITARKKDELARLEQTELLSQIVQQSSLMITTLEPLYGSDGRIEDFVYQQVNSQSLMIMGIPKDQVIGQRMRTLFPSTITHGIFEQLINVVQTGEDYHSEVYYKADGLELWLDTKYIRHSTGITAISFDLTPIRETQKEKLRQAGLMQTILEHTQGGLILYDMVPDVEGRIVDFRIVLANRNSEKSTKRPVEYIVNHTMLEEHPGLQATIWWEHIQRCVTTGEPQSFILPYNQEGVSGWFNIAFARFEHQILSTFLDVTALKEAELVQQGQAQQLGQVINSIPTALIVYSCVRDQAGAIIDLHVDQINEAAAQLLGQPKEALLGQLILHIVPETRDTPVYWAIEEVVKTGKPTRLEIEWFTSTLDVHIAPFQDGVVLSAMDITLIHQQREQLSWANQELSRSNESLESFAFIASHDLQEPLRKITSFADILHVQYASQLSEEVKDNVTRINTSAERMRLLIHDLLTYSRIKTERNQLVTVDLKSLIADLGEHELWVAIHQSKAHLAIGDLPSLVAEESQMRQLFQNLLANAFKFCHATRPCVVQINSQFVDKTELPGDVVAKIGLSNRQTKGSFFCEISIQDNGIGFDEKYKDQIFTVFQRLHSKAQYGGSGIGLSICKKIVEQCGGAILCQSVPDQGSTFRVYLPIVEPRASLAS